LIEHMGVGADGIGAPPGIKACRSQIARRFEAHHGGRSKKAAPPEAGDPMFAHKAKHRIIGGTQRPSASILRTI